MSQFIPEALEVAIVRTAAAHGKREIGSAPQVVAVRHHGRFVAARLAFTHPAFEIAVVEDPTVLRPALGVLRRAPGGRGHGHSFETEAAREGVEAIVVGRQLSRGAGLDRGRLRRVLVLRPRGPAPATTRRVGSCLLRKDRQPSTKGGGHRTALGRRRILGHNAEGVMTAANWREIATGALAGALSGFLLRDLGVLDAAAAWLPLRLLGRSWVPGAGSAPGWPWDRPSSFSGWQWASARCRSFSAAASTSRPAARGPRRGHRPGLAGPGGRRSHCDRGESAPAGARALRRRVVGAPRGHRRSGPGRQPPRRLARTMASRLGLRIEVLAVGLDRRTREEALASPPSARTAASIA